MIVSLLILRDDRVLSDLGREPRHPYLDESLLRFVSRLPPWCRCSPLQKADPSSQLRGNKEFILYGMPKSLEFTYRKGTNSSCVSLPFNAD